MSAADDVAAWEARGGYVPVGEHKVWAFDVPGTTTADPLLLLHGFPSCSFDWRNVLDDIRGDRRVVALDFLGFGLSDKPNVRYGIRMQADAVEAVARHFGLRSVALVTHDMGDSIGGEVLARSLDGTLHFEVTQRVLTNGSIYIDMAQLTNGQQLLLGLDDAPSPLINGDGYKSGLAGTFSPTSKVDGEELEAQWLFLSRDDGHTMLPRTIRYIEDRRAEERRYTGAIEAHPSPLGVVWGNDDPVAVTPMTDTLLEARPGTPRTILDNVGHYPMIESPAAFAEAVRAYL